MPPDDVIDDQRLHQLLGTLVERHRIPGAVLGVVDANRSVSVGVGTANLNTGAAMTAGFDAQIASAKCGNHSHPSQR